MELRVEELRKNYNVTVALDGCSFSLGEGMHGLLGPNGAGKSTLIKILTGNLSQDSGSVYFNGIDIQKLGKEYRKEIGYMPQEIIGYSNMSVQSFMEYMSVLKGIHIRHKGKKEIQYLLEQVNLLEQRRKKFKELSGGMKRRLLFAQALLGNPKILVLDEPTAGLDPKERVRMRNMIAELSEKKIVILATHIVSDVECIANKILLFSQGDVLKYSSPKELLSSLNGHVKELICSNDEVKKLSKQYVISNMRQSVEGIVLRIVGDSFPNAYKLSDREPTLDDVYMYYSVLQK